MGKADDSPRETADEFQTDEMRRLVNEQAEDEGLWFAAETAAEAYLQQELRRLHAAVEARAAGIGGTAGALEDHEGRTGKPYCESEREKAQKARAARCA